MKVWIYVEGESDKIALNALWEEWQKKLRVCGWGIQIIPLENKAKFFKKIGARTTEKLLNNSEDLVIGLPDLYPNQPFQGTSNQHKNIIDLINLQNKLVTDVLKSKGLKPGTYLARFFPSALKHDLEMLVLSSVSELKLYLNTNNNLNNWVHPVEDQNHINPPKKIVEGLFMRYRGRAYRETIDAGAILSKVSDLKKLIYFNKSQLQCPVFKDLLDWIGAKTNVSAF